MNIRYTALLIVAIAFGVARFIIPVEGAINKADIYKDLAHLFVGGCFVFAFGMIGLYRAGRHLTRWLPNPSLIKDEQIKTNIYYEYGMIDAAKIVRDSGVWVKEFPWQPWAIAIGLTALEVVAFLVRQK